MHCLRFSKNRLNRITASNQAWLECKLGTPSVGHQLLLMKDTPFVQTIFTTQLKPQGDPQMSEKRLNFDFLEQLKAVTLFQCVNLRKINNGVVP